MGAADRTATSLTNRSKRIIWLTRRMRGNHTVRIRSVEVLTRELCEVFGCEPSDGPDEVARKVIFKAREDFWVEEFAPGAAEFLAQLAHEIAIVCHPVDRRVDVPKRIEAIVRNAVNYLPRLQAPGIL